MDANTLYPMLVRDLLLSLATAGLYHARWTAVVLLSYGIEIRHPDVWSQRTTMQLCYDDSHLV